MYIITNQATAEVKHIFDNVHAYKDGIYSELAGGAKYILPYVTEYCEVDGIPEDVVPEKYCYTPREGFYRNPTWQEPNEWGLPDSIVQEIKDAAIAEVQKGVANGEM